MAASCRWEAVAEGVLLITGEAGLEQLSAAIRYVSLVKINWAVTMALRQSIRSLAPLFLRQSNVNTNLPLAAASHLSRAGFAYDRRSGQLPPVDVMPCYRECTWRRVPETLALLIAHVLCRLTNLLMTMQTRIPRTKLPLMTTHPLVSFIDIQLCLTTFLH